MHKIQRNPSKPSQGKRACVGILGKWSDGDCRFVKCRGLIQDSLNCIIIKNQHIDSTKHQSLSPDSFCANNHCAKMCGFQTPKPKPKTRNDSGNC